MTTLDRFRQAAARRAPVPIDINGETFYVRGLTGAERHAVFLNKQLAESRGGAVSDADWIAFGLCDEEGRPLFEDVDPKLFLAQLDGAILNKVAFAILKESGLAAEDTSKNS